jgi:hypothetical protein
VRENGDKAATELNRRGHQADTPQGGVTPLPGEQPTIYGEAGDRHHEAMALSNLGLALAEVRRFEEAISAHQDAVAIFLETADRHWEEIALGNLEKYRAAQAPK